MKIAIKRWKELSQMASDKLTFRPRPKNSESTSPDSPVFGRMKLSSDRDQLNKLLSAERDALQIEDTDLSNQIDSMQIQLKRVQKRLKLIESLLEDKE